MLTALTTYSVVAGFHVIFVLLFLGVTFSFPFIAAASRKEPQHGLFGLGITRKIQETHVIPGGLLVFASGLYLMIDGNWSDRSDNAWLTISMVWFIAVWLVGILVAYPAVKTMMAEAAAKGDTPGPPSELFQRKANMMAKVGPLMGVSTLIIAFLMEAKPF